MSSPIDVNRRLPQPLEWLFRDRETGGVTIAQLPNRPLTAFLALTVVRWVFRPQGSPGDVLRLTTGLALVWWAGDELVRGANPWRRILGATVVAFTVVGLIGLARRRIG